MAELDYPVMFLDIEGLERRWKCGLSIIQALAETDAIHFCLRPTVLEIALATIPPEQYQSVVRKLTAKYIDHRYVYMMFKDKARQIEISRIGDTDMKEILKDPLRVDFFDLVVPVTQIEEFEFVHDRYKNAEQEFELLSDDFTCFIWHGKEYKFGETQGKVIKCLWEARETGNPWVYGKRILRDIDSTCFRIKDIFGKNKYWRRIIVSDNKGKYKLNISPKQLSLFN